MTQIIETQETVIDPKTGKPFTPTVVGWNEQAGFLYAQGDGKRSDWSRIGKFWPPLTEAPQWLLKHFDIQGEIDGHER